MLFHLFYNVFFPQQEIVLQNARKEIFPKSCAGIGWWGPNQIVQMVRWEDEIGWGTAVICHCSQLWIKTRFAMPACLPHLADGFLATSMKDPGRTNLEVGRSLKKALTHTS